MNHKGTKITKEQIENVKLRRLLGVLCVFVVNYCFPPHCDLCASASTECYGYRYENRFTKIVARDVNTSANRDDICDSVGDWLRVECR